MAIKTINLQGGVVRYCVQIQKKGFPYTSKTFRTLADARDWETVMTADMVRGTWVPTKEAERTTLAEALTRYMQEVTPSKKGAQRETDRIKRWLEHPLAARFLATIRGKDIAEFRDEWRKSGLAENTIRLEIALLSQVFETARKEWGMESLANPCRNIKLPGSSAQRERRLQGDEEARLLEALSKGRNPHAVPIVRFAIATAMRQGEILGLKWADVDIKKRVAHLADTKNGESRDVPLSSVALDILNSMPRPIEGGAIFRMTQDGLIRAFSRACAAAGIEGLRFHDLRHEATSRLFESDFSIAEVSAITGHKTLQMLKRYTHLRAEDLARKLG
jgi:integrase